MSDQVIYYAIVALTNTEAEKVIENLREERKNELANWLQSRYQGIYGNLPEDWKPFNGKRIIELVEDGLGRFKSETSLISGFDENKPCIETFLHIRLYFIDIFAIFFHKYVVLAQTLNGRLYEAEKGCCCFVLYYGLPGKILDAVENDYRNTWRSVARGYAAGFMHRMAMRPDDIKNFKNYVHMVEQGSPNLKTSIEAGKHPDLGKQGPAPF